MSTKHLPVKKDPIVWQDTSAHKFENKLLLA